MTSGRNLALVCGLGATWLLVACGTSADSGGADQPDGSLSDATSGGDAAGGDASRPGNDAAAGSSGSGGGAGDAAAPDGRAGGGSSGAGSSGSGGSGSGSGGASSSGTSSSSGASGSGGPDGSATGGGDGSAPPASADVLQHHKNATRDGVFADDAMTAAYAGSLRLDATFAPAITGDVYAQPLYVTDGPVRSQEAFIVATEANHVTAVDATGVVLWDRTFGTPAAANNKPCGTITPLGITGTPVIDMGARAVYFDAMTVVSGSTMAKHFIHAISLDTGMELSGWPVDVNAAVPGFDSFAQHQHGALALVNGVVYVPYGGHNGDCNQAPHQYHGWVVGVNAANPASVTGFSTGTLGAGTATQGGIWATGGVASDGTSLFVSTGNTDSPTVWSGGEAVLRLDPGPVFNNQAANEFHMTDWVTADGSDVDLGGTNPVLFDMPGSATPHLAVAQGKDGFTYILNRDSLNGAGGELSKTALAPQGTTFAGSLKGAPAVYTTSLGTYVAYRIHTGPGAGCPTGGQTGSIGVARIGGSPPAPTVVWCSSETGLGSPMVTTSSSGATIVWDANARLFGYDGDTGAKVFDGTSMPMAASLDHFGSVIDASGRIVVATIGAAHLYVFKP